MVFKRSAVLAAVCVASATAGMLVVTATSSDAARPKLTVGARFLKTYYTSGQTVSVHLSVHNAGSTSAVGIHAMDDSGSGGLVVDQHRFGALTNPITIKAGKTVTVTVTGHLASPAATKVRFAGELFARGGVGVASFSTSAPVSVVTSTVRGTVYGDANANGKPESGEGLKNAKIRLTYFYGNGTQSYTAVTGAGGKFRAVVPKASYYVRGASGKWVVLPRSVRAPSAVALRAVRPLGKVLEATLQFAKSKYKPGDIAHLTVVLTNSGATTLRGIGAACDHAGDPNELNNSGTGWGALARDKPGVTLPAHTARAFRVTAKVPGAAQRAGVVAADCDFGYPSVDQGYRPQAFDTAKVPGQSGTITGNVYYSKSGKTHGLAKVRMVLVDATSCPVFTHTATTDAAGNFRLANVPASPTYQAYLYPPSGWKDAYDNPSNALVFGHDTVRMSFQVERGTAHVPAPTTKCS